MALDFDPNEYNDADNLSLSLLGVTRQGSAYQ